MTVDTRHSPLLLGALLLPLVPLAPAADAVGQAAPRADERAAYRAAPSVRHDVTPAATGRRFSFRTTERMVPVRVGPRNNIGISLDTTLYVPANATRKRPQPAILMTHGFGNTKDSNEVVDTARFFASHGYVVLTYTSSGFGDSGGCVTLQSADYDVKGARQLITKVLRPRKDVKRDRKGLVVGTIGGSYGGGIQLPLAAADRRIRAAIPGRTWDNLLYSLDPNNRVVDGDPTGLTHGLNKQGVFKQQWTTLFYALGNAQPAMGGGGCPEAKAASGDPAEVAAAGSCPGYYRALCQTYQQLTSTGDGDAAARRLVARASGATFINRIKIPVLLVQGQSDTLFNLNDASATYLALKRRKVPVGMIWNSGGHGGYSSKPGECEVYDGIARSVRQLDNCYLTLRSLRWMNHWLRGTKQGRGPAFTYHRDWTTYAGKGAADEQYGASTRFPLVGSTRFTLAGQDRLARPGMAAPGATVTLTNPSGGMPAAYTETSNFTGPDSSPSMAGTPPSEVAGQFAAFTSPAFGRSTASVGIPAARLRIQSTVGRDLVFFAKVFDVAPDGSTELIHRLISPVRVPATASFSPVDLRLAGFAHLFRKGHRVRLVLCTTDQTSYNSKVADVVTLFTGDGSTFTLPTSRP